jgi:hypothetical protein
VDEKILINEDKAAQDISSLQGFALHHLHRFVQLSAALDKRNVSPFEKVRCAAEVTPVRAAKPSGNMGHLGL